MIEAVRQNWQGMTLAVLLGTSSGVGGTVVYLNNISAEELQRIARPDPATGTEFRSLHRELDYHLQNHPDIVNRFDRRLGRLEAQVEILMRSRISP